MNPTASSDYPLLSIAPGRVNLLGEHVDYNDGPVLPAAIDRTVRLFFRPQAGSLVTLTAKDLNESASFDLTSLASHQTVDGRPLPAWAAYPAGVAWSLTQMGVRLSGLVGSFTSNLPMGSGLSSSAAVEVAFAAAWDHLAGSHLDHMDLARAAKRAENEYVGVNCGLMDQFASAFGVADHALYFNTRSLEWRALPLPPGTVIVIADSSMRRSLRHSGYNERRAACEQAVAILSHELPSIRALRDVSSDQFNELAHLLPSPARECARHVVEECERVDQAIPLLEAGDVDGFGRLMNDCHRSLRDLYRVSIPELDLLVRLAQSSEGCFGARLTGAGFGGCTVNLVDEAAAPKFMEKIKTGYLAETGLNASIYICKASQGVRVQPNR
jgi:galactokinase